MITINFAEFIGASLCAAKNDIRFYLNGIYVSAAGDVVGTNGHIMFAGKCVNSYDERDAIISIQGKPPTKFHHVVVDIDAKFADFRDKNDQSLCMLRFDIVDGHYPEWKRVMTYREEKISEIGLNMEYLNVMMKIGKNYLKSGHNVQKVMFQDTASAVHFKFSDDTTGVLMPSRIK